MAEPAAINIQIDEESLRNQVASALQGSLLDLSIKLREAADALDPEFIRAQNEWIKKDIEEQVARKLEGLTND